MFNSRLDTTDPFKRLRICENVLIHTVITTTTPKRPKITSDHTKSSQDHAMGHFFFGPRQTTFLHCPTPLPKPKENPPYLKRISSHNKARLTRGGRSWQPFGEGKNGHKIVVKHIFTILATNASFLRVIANLQI